MEIIARIPHLPCPPIAAAAGPSACDAVEGPPGPGSCGPADTGSTATPEDGGPAERSVSGPRTIGRRRVPMFPTPSVLVLAVIAAAVWAAAWRNERLRAIEQRRPQRVAMEPAPSAAAARSVTP